jgi:hypothetical protein
LRTLPNTLYSVYEGHIDKVNSKRSVGKPLAERTIKWLLCTEQPLRSTEFTAAICTGLDLNTSEANPERVVSACHNLVIWNEEVDQFAFSHLSVKEFILDKNHLRDSTRTSQELQDKYSLDSANAFGAEICLATLSSPRKVRNADQTLEGSLKWYAIVYWASHCQNAGPERVIEGRQFEALVFFVFKKTKGNSNLSLSQVERSTARRTPYSSILEGTHSE